MNNFAVIADMVKEAEAHAESLSASRLRAIEYYDGVMEDTPSPDGRSQQITRDVRSSIKKVMPSIMRTLLGSDEVVEFMPVAEGDEDAAEQAADYINYIIIPECDATTAIKSAINDALLLRNGILKWWFEEKKTVKISTHSGLNEDALGQIAGDDSVEVLESTERMEQVETPEGVIDVPVYDVKLRRTEDSKDIKVAAVPRERFLIHPDAVSFEESLITGEKTRIRRSDLVAMGHSREAVRDLSLAEDDEVESDARRESYEDGRETYEANQWVDYYDIFVRIDMDDDGISELRHMCFAGGLDEKHLLLDEEVDDVQFCDLKCEDQPHQWEGVSVADDLMDIQRVKTVLLRETLDNLYWQNKPQPVGQKGAIENPDSLLNPEFGKPIWVKQGFSVNDAYGFNSVPFVAAQSFGMMEYMDQEAQDRTGISEGSAGLSPDALQNMTATASAMIEQAGIGQTEEIVKTIARGLRVFFRGLLRLSIRHQDMPRTVRLRDEWVTFDPRHWNAEMDCSVNTGLGAGTRERDMTMMQIVMQKQTEIIAGLGPDNPFVKPENVSNALTKFAEAAGLKTPSLYFTEADPEEVAAQLEAQKNKPDPETVKMQAQMQLEQAKLQGQMQIEQGKLQGDMQKAQMQAQVARDKESAQMEADLATSQAQMQADQKQRQEEFAADIMKDDRKIALEREKMAMQERLKRLEIAVNARMTAAQITDKEISAETDAMAEDLDGEGLTSVLRERPDPNKGILEAMASLTQVIASQSGPKRVVRDENGDVTGIEVVQ